MNRLARTLSFLLVAVHLAMGVSLASRCLCEDGHIAVGMGCADDCRDTGTDDQTLTVTCAGDDACLCVPVTVEATPSPATLSTKVVPANPHFCGLPHQHACSDWSDQSDVENSLHRPRPMRTAAPLLDLRTVVMRT